MYLVIALLRLRYPFDLEWMEGGSVDHVARVLRGEPLYVAPHLDFIPFEYPPLYFYASAAVAQIAGLGYAALRFVSLLSSLVCFACIYGIVRGETGRMAEGVVAAGLFAATFAIGGAWLDLARVDTLFLALFLLALFVLRRSSTRLEHALAGMLFALSFLTKQPALAMALPVVAYAAYESPSRGAWLAIALFGACGLVTLVLHRATDGWFTFYVWWFPFLHGFVPGAWTTFWTHDMLGRFPIAFAAAVAVAGWPLVRRRWDALFWLAAFAGMVGGAYRSRVQPGGYDNVLIPAYAIAAILMGLAIGHARSRRRETGLYAACLLQMALLWYDPRPQIPRAADRAAGERLVALLRSVPGDVLVPYHGSLAREAGKAPHAHLMQVYDILKLGDARSAQLAAEFRAKIQRRAFGAIVLDDRFEYVFHRDVENSYELKATVFAEPDVFYPRTGGLISRPQYYYAPKPDTPRAR